jgi:hypothetical protein
MCWLFAARIPLFCSYKCLTAAAAAIGSYAENIYTLMCLGIPLNAIPVDAKGNPKTDSLFKWLKQRRIIERQQKHQQQQQQQPRGQNDGNDDDAVMSPPVAIIES